MDVAKLLAKAKEKKDALKTREKTLKPKAGQNRYVLLGDWDRSRNELFFREFGQHFVKNAAGDLAAVHVCLSKTYGEECPICDALAQAAHHVTDDSQIKQLDDAKAKQTYLLNVLEVDEMGKHDGQPKVLEVGKGIITAILEMAEEWGEAMFAEHQLIVVNREGTGLNTKYTVIPGSRKAGIAPETFTRLVDLDDYVNQANEEKKRLAISTIGKAVGIEAPAEKHIPAARTIGTSGLGSIDATDAEYSDVRTMEASRSSVAEIDMSDELDALLEIDGTGTHG